MPQALKNPSTDVVRLQTAVLEMDCLSQYSFQEIKAIAKLSLLAMETTDGVRFIENIAHALSAICQKAEDAMSGVKIEAERVGCDFQCENQQRRYKAVEDSRRVMN